MKGVIMMYILKNALKSISRSKGRNILIGIIVIVISISSCVALSIKNAAAKAEQQGLDKLSITARISLDRQKLMTKAQESGQDVRELMQSYADPTLDELKKYATSTNVKSFYYTITSSINASGELEPVDTSSNSSSSSSSINNNVQAPTNFANRIPRGMGNQGDFTITGYSSEGNMTNFVSGTSKITDGKIFDVNTSDLVCIINDELATFNNLKIGDKITLANPNVDTETYEFNILGIYKNSSSDSTSNNNIRFSTSMDPANQIYTSYNTLKAVIDKSASNATIETDEETGMTNTTALRNQTSGTYVFSNVAGYESFKTDVKTLGLSEYYTVSSNDATNYEQSLVPLKNLSKFATYFLLVVLAIGGVILVVFNIFNIRERKFEVGVLTAIGMKKGKVAIQFITEIFMVTLIAIVIGTSVGAVISVPTANKMLESQIASQQSQSQQQEQNFGRMNRNNQQVSAPGGITANGFNGFRNETISYISNIDAAIDLNVVIELLGIGILLTIISSCAAVVFVLRYEPLKILSERS
jgi:putative ABC transport system permease protein